MAASVSLKEAIQRGQAELDKEPGEKTTNQDTGKEKEGSGSDNSGSEEAAGDGSGGDGSDSEDSEAESEELSAEQLDNAKKLFKALNDPRTAGASIRFLIDSLGVEIPGLDVKATKEDIKVATRDLVAELKEAAPGLEFLIDKIGPIIKKHLEEQVTAVRADLEADRTERLNEGLKAESAQALRDVANKFKYKDGLIPSNVLSEMTRAMGKLQPGPDLKPSEFISILHDAARAKLGLLGASINSQNGSRDGNRGGGSPTKRLAAEQIVPSATGREPVRKLNIKQAIAAAVDSLGTP